jgi:hypothetical protein
LRSLLALSCLLALLGASVLGCGSYGPPQRTVEKRAPGDAADQGSEEVDEPDSGGAAKP